MCPSSITPPKIGPTETRTLVVSPRRAVVGGLDMGASQSLTTAASHPRRYGCDQKSRIQPSLGTLGTCTFPRCGSAMLSSVSSRLLHQRRALGVGPEDLLQRLFVAGDRRSAAQAHQRWREKRATATDGHFEMGYLALYIDFGWKRTLSSKGAGRRALRAFAPKASQIGREVAGGCLEGFYTSLETGGKSYGGTALRSM